MTKEEAIKWFSESPFMNQTHTPFLMAIKALQQPEIVMCKDCKFRQKSYVAYRQWWCSRLEKHCDDDWFCADGEKES